MKHSARAPRVRRGTIALALAALVGGGLAIPPSSPAQAADVEVPTASLVSTGTTWKYLDDSIDPASGSPNIHSWTAPAFDDSAWKSGQSGFGVKNNKLALIGPHMPTTKLEHYIDQTATPTVPTYFFRTTFTLDAGVADQVDSVQGRVLYDDGLRVFVNGELVRGFADERVNDALGNNLQYAGTGNSNPSDELFTFDGDLLQDCVNTVAVALYQDRDTSSDAYFDLAELTLVEAGQVFQAAPTRVILTPTETPSTSQSFSWRTGHASHETGQVEIGLASGGDTRVVDAASVGTVLSNQNQHFSATVDGLNPATSYRYRVGMTVGPVYAVSNSGAKHYSLETEEKNVWTNNGATQVLRGQNVTTYQVVDVSKNQLVYRSYLAEKPSGAKSFKLDTTAASDRPAYQPKEVPNVGDLYDEVTVTKYSTGEKWVTEAGVDVPAAPAVSASATSVEQGGEVTFSGTGFAPDSEVKIELHSTPVPLGTATVGSNGSFSATVTIPADTPTDVEHSLVAILPNGSMVSAPLTVTPAADSGTGTAGGSGATGGAGNAGGSGGTGSANNGNGTSLPNTGGTSYLPYGIAGTVLLLAGAAILVARRRMAAQHKSEVGIE